MCSIHAPIRSMRRTAPIPDSQKHLVRNAARRARREAGQDVATAKMLLGNYVAREVGGGWQREAIEHGEALLDYWHEHGVETPTVQTIEGEPV
jgi:hypothetical protein